MTRTLPRFGVLAPAVWLAVPVLAQETTDWRFIQETDRAECYAIATPTSQEATRDGEPVEVARSDTVLYVVYRPAEGLRGQVAFTGGYPFAADTPVTLEVEGTEFTLLTRDEWAWPANAEADARIVEAFRDGSEAVLTGQSERGTVTRDTFSLVGFSRSVEEAEGLCAS
jgi:hypothetical protein